MKKSTVPLKTNYTLRAKGHSEAVHFPFTAHLSPDCVDELKRIKQKQFGPEEGHVGHCLLTLLRKRI